MQQIYMLYRQQKELEDEIGTLEAHCMDIELHQLDKSGLRKKVYECAFVQQTVERAKKKKELEALMQMITTQENKKLNEELDENHHATFCKCGW